MQIRAKETGECLSVPNGPALLAEMASELLKVFLASETVSFDFARRPPRDVFSFRARNSLSRSPLRELPRSLPGSSVTASALIGMESLVK